VSAGQLRGGVELLGGRLSWAPKLNAELAAGTAINP
jgi:hypothetical protein